MKPWTALCLVPVLAIAIASAADADRISGHYRYTSYQVTLPNGRVIGLKEMGASEASLDISVPTRTITLHMTRGTGRVVDESARIVEWAVGPTGGYWIAQWPDMKYPVKAVISVAGTRLTSETHFDHADDMDRFGTIERAVLDRQ
ncbi:MAG: hypothetical protein RL684_234 [Pseudomonadota bacterium]|jgi:hypothetical protein